MKLRTILVLALAIILLAVLVVPASALGFIASGWTFQYSCFALTGPEKVYFKGGPLTYNPDGLHLTVVDRGNGATVFDQDYPLSYAQNDVSTAYAFWAHSGKFSVNLYEWQGTSANDIYDLVYEPALSCAGCVGVWCNAPLFAVRHYPPPQWGKL